MVKVYKLISSNMFLPVKSSLCSKTVSISFLQKVLYTPLSSLCLTYSTLPNPKVTNYSHILSLYISLQFARFYISRNIYIKKSGLFLNQHNYVETHPFLLYVSTVYSILLVSITLLYRYTTNLLIQSAGDRHMGCFKFGAILAKKTAKNIHSCIFFPMNVWLHFFWVNTK